MHVFVCGGRGLITEFSLILTDRFFQNYSLWIRFSLASQLNQGIHPLDLFIKSRIRSELPDQCHFCRVWASKFWSSCLGNKPFNHWAISLAISPFRKLWLRSVISYSVWLLLYSMVLYVYILPLVCDFHWDFSISRKPGRESLDKVIHTKLSEWSDQVGISSYNSYRHGKKMQIKDSWVLQDPLVSSQAFSSFLTCSSGMFNGA